MPRKNKKKIKLKFFLRAKKVTGVPLLNEQTCFLRWRRGARHHSGKTKPIHPKNQEVCWEDEMQILTKLEFDLDSKKFAEKFLTISLDDKSGLFRNHSLGKLKIDLAKHSSDEGNREYQVNFIMNKSPIEHPQTVLTFTFRTEWLRVGRRMVPSNLNGRGESFLDPTFIRQTELDPTNDDTPTETSAPTVSQSSEDDDILENAEKKPEEVVTPSVPETIEEPVIEIIPVIEPEPQPVASVEFVLEPVEIERRRLLRIDVEKVLLSILVLLLLINFLNI